MKKILSAAAVSALILTAGHGLAGNMKIMPPSLGTDCPADCQDQLDQLQSSQDRQDEQLEGLQESQTRQDEEIRANAANIQQNTQEIEALKNRQEENPWYVKGTAKVIWVGSMDVDKEAYGFKADTDTGYGLGLSAGREFGNLRIEGELATQQADIKGDGLSEVTIGTAMLNGFYDVPIYGPFSVYGMAGIGPAKVEISLSDGIEDSETTLAYKAGAGVAMDVAENMAVDLGYEYMRTGDIELGHDHELLRVDDIKNSSVNASVRYSF